MLTGVVIFTDFNGHARVGRFRTSFRVTLETISNVLSGIGNDQLISLSFHRGEFIVVMQSANAGTSQQILQALHASIEQNNEHNNEANV